MYLCYNVSGSSSGVRPVMSSFSSSILYGSECWAVTKRDVHKIDALGQWCLRKLLESYGTIMCGMTMWDGKLSNHTLSSTVQARRLSLFGHTERMPDESDAKQILSAPPGELEKTIRTSPCYVDEEYSAGPEINEPVRERSNRRDSESSTLEIDVYVRRYALIVVHGGNERMNGTYNANTTV